MESLAQLVAILVLTCILSGPLCLLLASKKLKVYTSKWVWLFIVRRIFVVLLGMIGAFISTNFLFSGVAFALLIGIFGAITIIVAMKREFDGVKYVDLDR